MNEDQVRMDIAKEINRCIGDLSGIIAEIDNGNITLSLALDNVMDNLMELSAEIIRRKKP